jgi:type II secretory pathway predicted ATPase ExeA
VGFKTFRDTIKEEIFPIYRPSRWSDPFSRPPQFDGDSKPWLPIILAGQMNLEEKLRYRKAAPLASRVVARGVLSAVMKEEMDQYLNHHLHISGVKTALFTDPAMVAIHQGSGGIYRKANNLARGALIAAAGEKSSQVTPDHVRIASSEIF